MLLHRAMLPKMKQPIVYSEDLRFMSIRSKRSSQKNKGNHTTTKLGIEQLESRLMNSIDALESSLQLLNSPGLFGSTQVVSNSTPSVSNTPPLVANPLRLTSGTAVLGRTASLSVLGADNNGESSLKYTWQPVEVPSGGNVSFASNGTNAAKKQRVIVQQIRYLSGQCHHLGCSTTLIQFVAAIQRSANSIRFLDQNVRRKVVAFRYHNELKRRQARSYCSRA